MKLSELQERLGRLEDHANGGCGNHGCVIYPPRGHLDFWTEECEGMCGV